MKKDPTIFEKQISAGSKKYYFEVKTSEKGDKYVNIAEYRTGETQGRIMVFEDHFEDFFEVMDEIMVALKLRSKIRLSRIRKDHPRAYEKWTEEEDETLERLFARGKSRKEIAELLERQPSAIRSRIRKMELEGDTK